MKIIRRQDGDQVELWQFFQENMPGAMIATIRRDEYGGQYGISMRSASDAGRTRRILGIFPITDYDRVAIVEWNTVYLYAPQWYSDFEDIIERYEELTGQGVEFHYWEGVVEAI